MPLPESGWTIGFGISHKGEIEQVAPGKYMIPISANYPYRQEYAEDLIRIVVEDCKTKGREEPFWIQCQWEPVGGQRIKVQLMGMTPN